MEFTKTSLEGVLVVTPRVFSDDRGYFFESYNEVAFKLAGVSVDFLQDNQSLSQPGVLRGLHFQVPPHAQGKLVRVLSGSVRDVVVDIRRNSPTYGKHEVFELSAENQKMVWIPPGFAHGFLALEPNTIFFYKCTDVWSKECEGSLRWNDPDLKIEWGITHARLSDKDAAAPMFRDFQSSF